jgi:cyclic pyranopterin phosphate synthase
MPEDLPLFSHDDVLRYEETLRLCSIIAKIGVSKIRVTGGEPLARKGCVGFLRSLKALPGIKHVTMTTNAVLLEQHIDELVNLGLDGLNISLDSLDPKTYQQITGSDELPSVLKSLNKAVDVGLRVKINCVPIRNVNQSEIEDIARLASSIPIDVRFIELMHTAVINGPEGVPSDEVLLTIRNVFHDLTPDSSKRGFGPAGYYKSAALQGRIGIIESGGNRICSECNRIRLTTEGFLKLCLKRNDGLDLRSILRGGASDSDIEAAVADAVYHKPERYIAQSEDSGIDNMSQIGG